MIGIPLEDEPKFTGWAVRTLQEGLQNLADLPEVFEEMTAYFVQHVAERRAMAEGSRPDDILTMLLDAETDQPKNAAHLPAHGFITAERRAGKACVRTGRSRCSCYI